LRARIMIALHSSFVVNSGGGSALTTDDEHDR
jgi:hypothetical protein